jgi:hypothetical protein
VSIDSFICSTCGTQYSATTDAPDRCVICDDERQYVPETGQAWTRLRRLQITHRNTWRQYEPALWGIGTEPSFAIGQRALLIRHPAGNVLWDCISLIDAATVDLITALGGVSAIAISHPHYYAAMVEWSHAFGGPPVYLHSDDREWVMRPDPVLQFWGGDSMTLHDTLTLVRCGGHFAGGSVLHWPAGADGRGALLTGDIIQVGADRKSVSFMFSYPNFIPLGAAAVERIARAVEPLPFDRIYGAWWDRNVAHAAKTVLARSTARYLSMLQQG